VAAHKTATFTWNRILARARAGRASEPILQTLLSEGQWAASAAFSHPIKLRRAVRQLDAMKLAAQLPHFPSCFVGAAPSAALRVAN
jgi:hypothetical protein